jgi:hypothetical protein
MTNELGRIWKEAIMAYLKYYASTCLEEVMETIKNLRIDSVPAEIQVRHLLYTSSVLLPH